MRDCNFIPFLSFPLCSMFCVATFGESPPFYVAVCNRTMSAGGQNPKSPESNSPERQTVTVSQRHDCKHFVGDWLTEYDFRPAQSGGRVCCDGVEEVWYFALSLQQPNHEDPTSAATTSCDKVQRKYVSNLLTLCARRRTSVSC